MNQFRLSARITEMGAVRHTPAGLPALDVRLEHESRLEECGSPRQVHLVLRAIALGAMAEALARQPVGAAGGFIGFMASPRNARSVVFHIQDFQPDQIQGGL